MRLFDSALVAVETQRPDWGAEGTAFLLKEEIIVDALTP